jgi:hypothetical protein
MLTFSFFLESFRRRLFVIMIFKQGFGHALIGFLIRACRILIQLYAVKNQPYGMFFSLFEPLLLCENLFLYLLLTLLVFPFNFQMHSFQRVLYFKKKDAVLRVL